LIAVNYEVQKYPKKIEIVVSDNNSTDSTKKTIEELQSYMDISYYKNKQNLGFDSNVNIAIKKSKANFVLLMSDDDILLKGSLEKYIDLIAKEQELTVVIGGANFFTHNLKSQVSNFKDEAFNNFKEKKTYIFENGAELMKFSKKIFCGVSGVAFNRKKYLQEDMQEFIGTQFIHTAAMFRMLSRGESAVAVINEPIFMYRLGDDDFAKIKSADEIMSVGLGLLDLLLKVKNNIDRQEWNIIYKKELNWVRRLLIGIKSREGLNLKIINRYKLLLDKDRSYKILDFIILKIPDILFKFPYLFYRLVKYKKIGYK